MSTSRINMYKHSRMILQKNQLYVSQAQDDIFYTFAYSGSSQFPSARYRSPLLLATPGLSTSLFAVSGNHFLTPVLMIQGGYVYILM